MRLDIKKISRKKLLIITITIVLSVSFIFHTVNASKNEENQNSVRVILPYYLSLKPLGKYKIDFGTIGVHSIELVDSLQNMRTSLEDNILRIVTSSEHNKNYILDRDFINYFSIPLHLNHAVIDINFEDNVDINTILQILEKEFQDEGVITNNTIDFSKNIEIYTQDPFNGSHYRRVMTRNDLMLPADLFYLSEYLNDEVNADYENFLMENPDIVDFTKNLVKDSSSNIDKGLTIMKYILENKVPFDEDLLLYSYVDPITLESYSNLKEHEKHINLKYIWENQDGNCQTFSYLAKVMLDIADVENNISVGYIEENNESILHMEIMIFDEIKGMWGYPSIVGDVFVEFESFSMDEIAEYDLNLKQYIN